MTKQELIDILEAGTAATIIVKVFCTKALYSKNLDQSEMLRIMNIASEILQYSLKKEVWKDYVAQFRTPIYEEILPSPVIIKIVEVSTSLLKGENILLLGQDLSKELADLFKNMDEIMIFDCKFPTSELSPLFSNKKRYLMLLQQYWAKYLNILQSLGTAYLGYKPNPLTRFILNLQYRIHYCIEQIGDENLLSSYENILLDPITSDEFSIEWDCGGQTMAMEFDKDLNELIMKTGIRHFELTMHEEMFLETCEEALETVDKRIKDDWSKMLARIEKRSKKDRHLSQSETESLTCSDYIKKVENTLRDLVKIVYKNNFSNEYLNKIKLVLGETAYLEAIKRMKSRKVDELEDILYFTYLTEVHALISKEWRMFKDIFSIRKNEFNVLMSIIIKGRTEEAHNRPVHLWPTIEQERTKVACYDLLRTIKK